MRTFREIVELRDENQEQIVNVVKNVVSFVKFHEDKVILGLKDKMPVFKADENGDFVLTESSTIFVMRGQVLSLLSEQMPPEVMLSLPKSNMLLSLILMGAKVMIGWRKLDIGKHENLYTGEEFELTEHPVIDIILGDLVAKKPSDSVLEMVNKVAMEVLMKDMMSSFEQKEKKDNTSAITNTELAI